MSSADDLHYQAETILSNEGTKAIAKCIAVGNINTALFQMIAKLAQERGVKLRVKESINKYMNFTPLLRSLHTIHSNLRYDDDYLMYSAVREQITYTVEYLLMHGKVDPLCRRGDCLVQAYIHLQNQSLTRMLLDYLPSVDVGASAGAAGSNKSMIPEIIVNTAVDQKDFAMVRFLLSKGAPVTEHMLAVWFEQKEDRDWLLMRLYLRCAADLAMQYNENALPKLCMEVQADEAEQNSKREMFSLMISHGLDVSALLENQSDPSKLDQFTHFMMSEQSRGLYNVSMNVSPKPKSKKRKVQEVAKELVSVVEKE